MRKLTPDQQHYRKRKKLARKDFVFVPRPDSDKKSVQVTRRALCIRVSSDVFDALDRLARHYQLTKGDMLTHMINHSLPQYQSLHGGMARTIRYDWPYELLHSVPERRRYARNCERQLNLRITSTAWKKLQCHSNAAGLSKKRVVQQLIRIYSGKVIND